MRDASQSSVAAGFGLLPAVASMLAALALLGACGQKGPLMLPKPLPPASAASSPAR